MIRRKFRANSFALLWTNCWSFEGNFYHIMKSHDCLNCIYNIRVSEEEAPAEINLQGVKLLSGRSATTTTRNRKF
jgi:hypothetical protein